MSNLQRYDAQGFELVINETTGEAYASIRGYSRMANKAVSTISERIEKLTTESAFEGVRFDASKMAETQEAQSFEGVRLNLILETELDTPGGKQVTKLLSEKLIAQWLPKDNPELASKMLQAGVRVFLYGIAGYTVSAQPSDRQTPPLVDILKDRVDKQYQYAISL